MKFKAGDRIKYTKEFLDSNRDAVDVEYVVSGVSGPWLSLDGYLRHSDRALHPYRASWFELVDDTGDERLTPQEVLQCIQDEVVLEYWDDTRWRTSNLPNLQVSALLINKYRKKPIIHTVTINGVEVHKPVDISRIVSSNTTIYSIESLEKVYSHNIVWARGRKVPVWETREHAQAALDAIRLALGIN